MYHSADTCWGFTRHRTHAARNLSALTSLTLMPRPCTGAAKWRDDQPDVILPPNLKTLRFFNCASARPLLALAALEVLSISKHCEIPAIILRIAEP